MRLCSAPALIPHSRMREESGGSLLTNLCVGAALSCMIKGGNCSWVKVHRVQELLLLKRDVNV